MSKFNEKLSQTDSEKLVESIYHQELERALKASGVEVIGIKTSLKTDGIIDTSFQLNGRTVAMKIIVEVKQDETFQNATVRSKALSQVLFYLKKLDMNGFELPHIVFVGDKNECFVLHTNLIVDYLNKDLNWKIAPSKAHMEHPDLVLEMSNDEKLQAQCFVYSIDSDFQLETVVERMKGLTANTLVKVRVNEKNIAKIFEYFSMNVLSRKSNGQAKHSPREQVEYFMHLVNNKEDCYIHPNKPGKAIFNGIEVDVRRDAFNQFRNHYEFNYTVEEKKEFTAIADRLIEDSDRRRKGDFYTPQIWVDESNKMLAENLGVDWKEEYMVWDCAAGTMNLTRDYKFENLYSSTLEEHDLKIGEKYNPGSVKFQYDFLNDDVQIMDNLLKKVEDGYKLSEKDFYVTKLWQKAPGLVKGMLEGKKLLFFINPPYGTANNLGAKKVGGSKEGMAKTKVNTIMLADGVGASSQQLYAQFMYRITKIKAMFRINVSIGIFTKSAYMTAPSFKKFREIFLNEFQHEDAMLFQASHFADVSGVWGIDFSVWVQKIKTDKDTSFKHKLKDLSDVGEVVTMDEKLMYNIDNSPSLSDWIKEDIKRLKTEDAPQLSSGVICKEKGVGNLVKGALGYYVNVSNSVYKNSTDVYMVSSTSSMGHGISVMPVNFKRVLSSFASRKLITGKFANWVNDKDEYMIPNIEHELYKQWENDSIVYSLFNTSSNQSSLREVEYKDKNWDIYNHFFFMSKDEILQLATNNEHINNQVEQDIYDHGHEERYVYEKIKEIEEQNGFSEDAQEVVDKARELVRTSFKYRELFNMEHPEYHINTWDTGWYQIKGMLKEYDPDGLKEFAELYKQFEDRMRPLVYELGFLRK